MDTMTVKESQPVPKVQASSSFGFRIGGIYPQSATAGDQSATGGGFYWLYDSRAYLIDLAFDAYWGKASRTGYAGFGAYYPFTKTNLAPYAGGGVRYAWGDYGASSGRGFQLYGTAGLLVGRLSTAGIRAELEWWANTFDTGPSASANGAAWKVGVYF